MKAQKPYSVTRIGGCAGGVAMSRLGEGSGSGAQGAGGSLRVQTGMQVVRSSGFGQGGTCRGSALGVGLPDSRISLSPYARPPARLLPVASAGRGCSMSRLGALGGARAGLGLLLGTAAGLGFLCLLYSQRWKRTQRHGRSQSLPNSLDYTQTSETGRQGRSPSPETAVTAD